MLPLSWLMSSVAGPLVLSVTCKVPLNRPNTPKTSSWHAVKERRVSKRREARKKQGGGCIRMSGGLLEFDAQELFTDDQDVTILKNQLILDAQECTIA